MGRTFLLFALCLVIAVTASPATLKDGFEAYKQGDYGTAIEIWLQLAERGDATAQFNLAQMYRLGKGVPRDDSLAAHWYLLAARQGLRPARHNLSMMYQEGRISRERLGDKADEETAASPSSSISAAAKPRHTPELEPRSAADEAQPEATRTVALSGAPRSESDWRERFGGFDSNHYVVQLMASPDQRDVESYLADHANRLPERRGYVRTYSKGREWYVLLLGPYASSEAANAAVAKLPAALRANKPWIRQVEQVKSILR